MRLGRVKGSGRVLLRGRWGSKGRPKMPQDPPRSPQDGPRSAQEGARKAQHPPRARQAICGGPGMVLGRSLGDLGSALGGLEVILGRPGAALVSPYSPSGLVTTPGLNPPPSKFDLKALLTSLHFSSLFLLRLGSLLGSLLEPFWRLSWLKFGPSCL